MFAGVVAIAIGACANPRVQECGPQGILCPDGTHCAAAQGICLPDTNTCGNAHMDPGEACDDGNTEDGDGCSHDCSSTEVCGNHIHDVLFKDPAKNEVCDDGNTEDGDGCSHDCLSLETCGNGIKDVGEVCDDGNTEDGDGCNHNCTSDETCGNNIVDVHERCDDGNTNDGDACSHDCLFGAGCGNGIIDVDSNGKPKEECDDGNTDNNDDCRNDCVVNRCGDGILNSDGTHKEKCDAADPQSGGSLVVKPTETADCNADCTKPLCGDGKVNHSFKPDGVHGEQCDDIDQVTHASLNADDRDCTANCQINVCGDNLHNTVGPLHIEICDDGNASDNDGCTNTCVDDACGDGIVDLADGEKCDLGTVVGVNRNSDSSSCPGCQLAICGDGHIQSGVEECDPPRPATATSPGCSATCKIQQCGNGIIDPGEECDKGAANDDNGDCRTDCIANRCGDGFLNTHGAHPEQCEGLSPVGHDNHTVTPTETATCNINCTIPACGDNIINRQFIVVIGSPPLTEQCDDGTRANGDGCSADCQFEKCGNGIVDPGEQCDNGSNAAGSGCFQCHREECGNGILDFGEQCDDGNTSDHDDCVSNSTATTSCKVATCGDGHIDDLVTATHPKREECDDGVANGTPGDPCTDTCHIRTCGNGILEAPEECDDHNTDDADGCEHDCKLPFCGNGITDPGEQCDDGRNDDGDTCEHDCRTPFCGNGITDPGEQCDDGNNVNGDACEDNCKLPVCGNGIIDPTTTPAEVCDDGNNNACGSCGLACGLVINVAPAAGLIFADTGEHIANAGVPVTFTLKDGAAATGATTVTFTFIFSGLPAANQVLVSNTSASVEATASAIVAAVNRAANGLRITATAVGLGGLVTLQNQRSTSDGNTPVDVSPGSSTLTAFPMAGGKGGDCATDVGCVRGDDCLSGVCKSTGKCQ